MKRYKPILLIIFALLLSSLACNLSFRRQSTQAPEEKAPVTTEAVNSLEDSAEQGYQQDLTSGEVTLVVSEAQLTSLLAFELEEAAGDVISNLQVYLRDGEIQLFGDVNQEGFSAPVKAVVEVSVDPAGRPVLNVISSSVGPFPVPGELISELEVRINKSFREQIETMSPDLRIEKIVIENGTMIIIGHTK